MATIERSAILVKKEGNNEIWYYPVTRTEDILAGDEQLDAVLTEIADQITAIQNGTIFDTTLSSTSTKGVQNKVIYVALNGKVDKVDGKDLSSNDFTDALLTKLNGIATGATKVIVDSALSSSSTNAIQNKAVQAALNNKVDKVDGKDLSSNDFTDDEKTKLAGIAEGANKTTVDSALSSSSTNPVQNKVVNTALGNKVDKVSGKDLSSNDYTDDEKTKLAGIAEGANKTTVDSALSSSSTNPVQNKVVQAAINDLLTKINNMIADAPEAYDTFKEISDYLTSHESEYEALVNLASTKVDKVDGKDLSSNDFTDALLTKLNGIATGATKVTVDSALSSSSTNPVQNKVINTALGNKVDKVDGKDLSSNDFTDTLLTKLNGLSNYIHPTFAAASSGLYKITVNANGHVSATSAVTTADIKSLLGFDIQLGSTTPSSVTVETYFLEIEEAETVA